MNVQYKKCRVINNKKSPVEFIFKLEFSYLFPREGEWFYFFVAVFTRSGFECM